MTFFTEPCYDQKTILSDLQGAWRILREEVVKHAGFPHWERVLFHIDEAMSWEAVRHLERMGPLALLIRNLALQGEAPAEIQDTIEDIVDPIGRDSAGFETRQTALTAAGQVAVSRRKARIGERRPVSRNWGFGE